jgi:hypothetical protein
MGKMACARLYAEVIWGLDEIDMALEIPVITFTSRNTLDSQQHSCYW